MSSSDHDDIGWHIWVGTITTIVPATLAVTGRFLARYISRVRYWWDDWMILIALIINWAMAITRWVAVVQFGHGRHAWTLPADTVAKFQKSFLAVQITYFGDAVTTKAALLFLYYRIFGISDNFRKIVYVSASIIIAYGIACPIVAIAGCQPVSYFWNKNQPGRCIDEVNFFRWNGICSMLLDFLILCLPLPMAWRLKVTVRQKIIISCIFLLGFFVCLVSILRIVAFNGSHPNDPTFTTVDTAMWSSIEQSVAILCGCLPTLRPLFRRLYGSTDRDHSQTSDSHARSAPIHLSRLRTTTTTTTRSANGSSQVGFARLSNDAESTMATTGAYSGYNGDVQSSVQHTDDESPTHVGIEIKRDFHQTTTMT